MHSNGVVSFGAVVQMDGMVWPLSKSDIEKVPYFQSALDGRWAEGNTRVIHLRSEFADGLVTRRGLEAALSWAYAGNPKVTVDSWREVLVTAMFLGCVDDKYINPFAELVRYEEVNVFDVVEWLLLKTEWLTAKPDTASVELPHRSLLHALLNTLYIRLPDHEWITRCKAVPTWILVEMLRMGGQNVRYTLDWLKNISPELKKDCDQSILTLPTETERNANTTEPNETNAAPHDCWAHEFLLSDQTRQTLEQYQEYPQCCPVCSESKSAALATKVSVVRTMLLRPSASPFPLKLDLFAGAIEACFSSTTTVDSSPAEVCLCTFKSRIVWLWPYTEVVIETPVSVYRGGFGKPLSHEKRDTPSPNHLLKVTIKATKPAAK